MVSDCQKLSQGISPRRSLLQEGSLTLKAHGHEMSWILVSKLRASAQEIWLLDSYWEASFRTQWLTLSLTRSIFLYCVALWGLLREPSATMILLQ